MWVRRRAIRASGARSAALSALGAAALASFLTLLATAPASADELSRMGDEFGNRRTLASWRSVYQDEGWGANQLEGWNIGATRRGWMMLMPYTSTWYQDYRGALVYKPVQGDFVVTTRLMVNRRGGAGPPRSPFSLAGLMIRTPRSITPQTWTAGGENYVFLSLGAADSPGSYQYEVKTTVDSNSQLLTSAATGGTVLLQIARIGSHIILLRQAPGGRWVVHQRYSRPDFPVTLQVGLTVYTDWPTASSLTPFDHNSTVILTGNPDLVALADYVRYHRPRIPVRLRGREFSNPGAVSDQELLSFLGARAAGR